MLSIYVVAGAMIRSIPRVSTLPPEVSTHYETDQPSSQLKLERSNTDRPRCDNLLLPEEEAQFFDEKIPVQQKV